MSIKNMLDARQLMKLLQRINSDEKRQKKSRVGKLIKSVRRKLK